VSTVNRQTPKSKQPIPTKRTGSDRFKGTDTAVVLEDEGAAQVREALEDGAVAQTKEARWEPVPTVEQPEGYPVDP
jgi:hypothetical protein